MMPAIIEVPRMTRCAAGVRERAAALGASVPVCGDDAGAADAPRGVH
jgi:hypothetical protein